MPWHNPLSFSCHAHHNALFIVAFRHVFFSLFCVSTSSFSFGFSNQHSSALCPVCTWVHFVPWQVMSPSSGVFIWSGTIHLLFMSRYCLSHRPWVFGRRHFGLLTISNQKSRRSSSRQNYHHYDRFVRLTIRGLFNRNLLGKYSCTAFITRAKINPSLCDTVDISPISTSSTCPFYPSICASCISSIISFWSWSNPGGSRYKTVPLEHPTFTYESVLNQWASVSFCVSSSHQMYQGIRSKTVGPRSSFFVLINWAWSKGYQEPFSSPQQAVSLFVYS